VKLSDTTLMLFHDGELDAEDARRVRVRRLKDPSVGARLEALAELGDAVRAWAMRERSREQARALLLTLAAKG
jgi:hypothetical protein